MFQKKELQELENLSLEELTAHHKEVMVRKAELLQKKKASSITEAEQKELEDITLYNVAVEKQIKMTEAKAKAEAEAKAKAKAEAEADAKAKAEKKSDSKFAVLKLSRGRRFDPNTGKRIAPVFTQTFRAGEYRTFMAHYKSLGYTIEEVVSNPFKED